MKTRSASATATAKLRRPSAARQRAEAAELLQKQEISQHEWLAWRQICKELKDIGVDINRQNRLACALRLWGEELVQLRLSNPDNINYALVMARRGYKPHVIDNPESL